jgi:hypothetical protein
MQEIFNSMVQKNSPMPFPSLTECKELINQYNITQQQINTWFKDEQKCCNKKAVQHSALIPALIPSSFPFPDDFKVKPSNLPPELSAPAPEKVEDPKQGGRSLQFLPSNANAKLLVTVDMRSTNNKSQHALKQTP